jgi:hypothetical protein
MRLTRAVAFVRCRPLSLIEVSLEFSKTAVLCALLCCLLFPAHATTTELNTNLFLPLTFEPNRGQAPAEALYLARSAEGSILLNKHGIVALLGSGSEARALRIRFVGAATDAATIAEEATGGIANYYGKGKRLESIPFYSRVRYKNVYNGTDIVFHGRTGRLEFDFELAPAADPKDILIDVSDADRVALQDDKSLLLSIGGKQMQLLAPEAYQEINGSRVAVQASYRVSGKSIAFELGSYDNRKTLIIDPVVAYTALFATNSYVNSKAGFADSAGNFYFAGDTQASDFPVTVGGAPSGGIQSAAFLMKINATGTAILVSTIVESSGARALASDASGNLYLAGRATEGFTATTGPITSCTDSCSGFVAKLNASGQLIYSTLLATGDVLPYAIAADSNGNAYITGEASDDSLATVNAFQPVFQNSACSSCSNAFFAKLNPTGSGYEFASYFGIGYGQSIALDQSGNIYLAGVGAVPLANPLQIEGNIFISKFSPDGQTLLSSTQFGGGSLAGMGVGSDGTVYLAGTDSYPDFPLTLNAFRLPTVSTGFNFSSYMFATALKPNFSGLAYSTYLGQGVINNVVLGPDGKLYLAGHFHSEPLVLKTPVVSDGSMGGFVLSLDKTGALSSATQYGGRYALQIPTAMGVDGSGNIYITGVADGKTPINIGTGDRYTAQQLALSLHTTFIAKIATTSAPQVSLSLYLPSQILRNVGSTALNIQSMSLVSSGTKKATSCGTSVAPGASCILTLTPFGTVTINSNAQPAAQTYLPIVTDIPSPITLWPDRGHLYFGLQSREDSSGTQSFRLWNVATAPVTITGITTNGAVSQSNNCPSSLDPEEYCTIQVTVLSHPTSDGGGVTITANGQYVNVPAIIHHTTNRLALSAYGIGFDTQLVGAPSLPRIVTVTNSGSSSFNLVYSLTGANEFAIAGTTCGSALAPHTSCSIALSFTPTVAIQIRLYKSRVLGR